MYNSIHIRYLTGQNIYLNILTYLSTNLPEHVSILKSLSVYLYRFPLLTLNKGSFRVRWQLSVQSCQCWFHSSASGFIILTLPQSCNIVSDSVCVWGGGIYLNILTYKILYFCSRRIFAVDWISKMGDEQLIELVSHYNVLSIVLFLRK